MSPATFLREQHTREDSHKVTVEDVPDEYDIQHPLPSASAAPAPAASPICSVSAHNTVAHSEKPSPDTVPFSAPIKTASQESPIFDVQSEELFPALGGASNLRPPPIVPTAWGAATSSSLNPASGAPKIMSMPGKHVERIRFAPSQMLPRSQLKKPIRDILRDTSRRFKAVVDMYNGPEESIIFEGKGSVDAVRQALKEVAQQVGSKQSVCVPIPASARPHIIGRQGAVVQGIHDRTGARINVARPGEPSLAEDDDDSVTIDVRIEGDAVAAEMARREIESILKERSLNITLRLRNISPELFPFIAGAHNVHLNQLEERTKARIKIPHYDTWSRPPPSEAAAGQVKFSPDPDKHIQISGERSAAQDARAEIERIAEELHRQITVRQLAINRGQHQFVLGNMNRSLHDFLAQTGCSIVLPPANDDTEFLTIIGPPVQIEFGINRVMDLATSMQMASIDISRQHPAAPSGPHVHARALTSYLMQRQAINKLERQYDAHIVLPPASDGPVTWEVYSRDGKNTIRARSDIINLIQAHPPSKIAPLLIDPYFHSHLRSRVGPQLKDRFGVHLVLPEDPDSSTVVLVYEGHVWVAGENELPRIRPPTSELSVFENALTEAKKYLFASLGNHHNICNKLVAVPLRYHDKLRKFIDKRQQAKGEEHIPIAVSVTREQIQLRGRACEVEELSSEIEIFVLEQQKDDLERGYTLSFEFPQKYANILIGKRGENINNLREEFDVDIKVENGIVEIRGPKVKANNCRARITALGKKLDDETTYVLKIPQQYHRDLIGQKGSQVNRLEERYNVRIQFPRVTRLLSADGQSLVETASQNGHNRSIRPAQAHDEVVIRGPRKGADEARGEILSLYQWVMDHSHSDFVSVAQNQIPMLIGQKGREMDRLRADTGAQIDVPSANDAPDAVGRVTIKLKGTTKQVADAKKLLLQRVQDFDSTVVKTIDVDKKHHKALIGGGGATIRKIISDAGGPSDGSAARMVKFPSPTSPDSIIRLEGNSAVVQRIIAAIEDFVREKDDQIIASIDIPQAQHRFLIGRGGEARRNIESQFKIVLDIPKHESGRTDINIRGSSGAVQEAKAYIQSLVEEQHADSILVPGSLHHIIAENGALFRRLRKGYQVSVDHAGHHIPPRPDPSDIRNEINGQDSPLPLITDGASTNPTTHSWKMVDLNPTESADLPSAKGIPWVFSGTPENVAKAKSIVEMSLQTASQNFATGYLILPDPKNYQFVIGPGGSTINEIRKQTNCRINVPKNQARGEAIQIKGPRTSLNVAKDMILKAVLTNGGRYDETSC
ncbi:RNA binding effector protein Scp160 [Histoplasma capsulatum]|uniref:RNA binding effector protein Scp160 n=1 Tax=Ajellomyces capsulatus TaxID=5037 RepID=A0A8A1MK39_AJECA|nr:RNA binding effector protein Scp160 [Histoplasma capsulatum]